MSELKGVRVFTGGATRASATDKGRFDLVSPIGERRLAKRYEYGAVRYGDRTWEKGIPASSCIDSAKRHINDYMRGDDSEDHLAAAAWNLFTLMDNEHNRPDMIDIPARTTKKKRKW